MFSNKHYVSEIGKELNFSRAAKNLFLSQPALSATIKRLEERLGMPLFDRSTTPIRMTECGMRYLQAAEAISAIEQDFEAYLADARGQRVGQLAIGGSHLFTSYIIPPLVHRLVQAHPQLQVHIREDHAEQLEARLLAGDLDCIVDNGSLDETRFSAHDIQEEHLVLAVPAAFPENEGLARHALNLSHIREGRHRVAETAAISLHPFADCPFILLNPHNDTHDRALKLCQESGFSPHVLLQMDQQATAYNITCAGMGISFVSDTLLQHTGDAADVTYYRLDEALSRRMIRLYMRKNGHVSWVMRAVLEVLTCKKSTSSCK